MLMRHRPPTPGHPTPTTNPNPSTTSDHTQGSSTGHAHAGRSVGSPHEASPEARPRNPGIHQRTGGRSSQTPRRGPTRRSHVNDLRVMTLECERDRLLRTRTVLVDDEVDLPGLWRLRVIRVIPVQQDHDVAVLLD